MGDVLGAEQEYLAGKPDEENDFFIEKKALDLQDITFNDIEKTKLGRAIKK